MLSCLLKLKVPEESRCEDIHIAQPMGMMYVHIREPLDKSYFLSVLSSSGRTWRINMWSCESLLEACLSSWMATILLSIHTLLTLGSKRILKPSNGQSRLYIISNRHENNHKFTSTRDSYISLPWLLHHCKKERALWPKWKSFFMHKDHIHIHLECDLYQTTKS